MSVEQFASALVASHVSEYIYAPADPVIVLYMFSWLCHYTCVTPSYNYECASIYLATSYAVVSLPFVTSAQICLFTAIASEATVHLINLNY